MDMSKEELMAILAERARQIGALRAALKQLQADVAELKQKVASIESEASS